MFGAVIKTALLTAQRFHNVSTMRRSDLRDRLIVPAHRDRYTGQWVDDAPIEHVWDASRGSDDPKNKQVSTVPLSAAARAVIASVPDLGGDCVFSLNGNKSVQGFGKYKKQLDARLKAALAARGVPFRPWQYRDLRRTARTLMALCLAHVIRGVEGVYDRHKYLVEKRHAFDELAALIERIVTLPSSDNVVPLGSAPTRRGVRTAR